METRHESGLSQRALAEKLGELPSWIAKIELGERRIDVVEFTRIARALGTDPVKLYAEVAKSVKK